MEHRLACFRVGVEHRAEAAIGVALVAGYGRGAAALSPTGRLIVELGYDQIERVSELSQRHGWQVVSSRNDLQDIPRVLTLAAARSV